MKKISRVLLMFFLSIVSVLASDLPKNMKTSGGRPRYWGWTYNCVSSSNALVMFQELQSWGCTEVVLEGVKWPTEVKLAFPHSGDVGRYDAICRAAGKYGMKLWVSCMARDTSKPSCSPELAAKVLQEREEAGFYLGKVKGAWKNNFDLSNPEVIQYRKEEAQGAWVRHYDLRSPAFIQYQKDLMSELREKYGHYNVIAGFVFDEQELTLLADPLNDDIDDFSVYCEKNFGEKYTGKVMPQFNKGVDPQDVWVRREMLYRMHIINDFLSEMKEHAHKLGFAIIKPNRHLEGWDGWPWKCGMNVNEYSAICDYVWCASGTKASLDPYLNYDNIIIAVGIAYGRLAEKMSASFHGKNLSDHAYSCGTTTRLPRYTDTEWELFCGHQNNRNWFNLLNSWTGGESPARVAVAINSPVFTMQYPQKTNGEYKRFIAPLFEKLSEHIDVDGFQLPQTKCLEQYPCIIIPHGVPVAMEKELYAALTGYVKEGGIIITTDALWSIGRKDMTDMSDVTEEITGCKVEEAGESESSLCSEVAWLGKVDCGSTNKVKIYKVISAGPEVKTLAVHKESSLLAICERSLGKGKVISCWSGIVQKMAEGENQYAGILAQIISHYIKLPITAEGNIQIVQTVLKDKRVAVVMADKNEREDIQDIKNTLIKLDMGEAEAAELGLNLNATNPPAQSVLKIDVTALQIPGKKLEGDQLDTMGEALFSVKDIITGREVESPYRDRKDRDLNRYAAAWTAEELRKGIPLTLGVPGEFKVMTVAGYGGLDDFAGVMSGVSWQAAESLMRKNAETPTDDEMGLNSPDLAGKKGIVVGIFKPIKEISKETFGAEETFRSLSSAEGIVPIYVNDISLKTLKEKNINVLIYCQSTFKDEKWIKKLVGRRNKELAEWVRNGGGLLAKHNVVGYQTYEALFPEICAGGTGNTSGLSGKDAALCVIAETHPATGGFKVGDEYPHSYADHVQLISGTNGTVIIKDKINGGQPVVIAGETGKGRYIADGTLGGGADTKKLAEAETKLLVNYVKWLGKNEN